MKLFLRINVLVGSLQTREVTFKIFYVDLFQMINIPTLFFIQLIHVTEEVTGILHFTAIEKFVLVSKS